MRNWLRNAYDQELRRKMAANRDKDFSQSAIVFAPHQDDETLGCGGVIIKKVHAGADVWVIYTTDGRRSHAHLMDAQELKARRAEEAVAACRVLGVPGQRVLFLGFKNGELDQVQSEAEAVVAEYLQEIQPSEVYVPHQREAPPDHYVTSAIVREALKTCAYPITVYEYPVWLWQHWPWTSLPNRNIRATLKGIREAARLGFGRVLIKDFNEVIDIRNAKETKREALGQHKTQMTRLNQNPEWAILSDVSSGEWLACFFQDYEIFKRYQLSGSVTGSR